MTEVLFLSSVQGFQEQRVAELSERLRKDRSDVTVKVVPPDRSGALLAQRKLKFGPAIVIGGRLEFVGVPRYSMLLNRIEISIERAKNPPPPEPAAPPAVPRPTSAPAPSPTAPVPPPAKPSA